MRQELYIRDDDYRLSFLYGNFITLTNVRDEEINRIVKERLSPLYVSIHTTNPELRALMLGRKKKDRLLEHMERLSDAGIELHIQMVMCPGLNDRDELERSIEDLANKYSGISSVGIVPVGLTRYRDGTYPLRPFEKQEISYLIEQVQRWQAEFEKDKGCAWVYIADEFYIAGECELPPAEHYAGFPQLENGIGLSRLFIDEVKENLVKLKAIPKQRRVAIVTGDLFSNIMGRITSDIDRGYGVKIDVIKTKNAFFGENVTVTGLLTGSDILASVERWLKNNEKPGKLLLPDVLLNGDGLMLDDCSPETIAEQFGIRVEVISSSGSGFIEGVLAHCS
ncbi:MAG: DUF512 domain-containing protein [Actinobacteria bacterium]|nr:DUF512 domain-containing protein [Actinomycetota bacterium]